MGIFNKKAVEPVVKKDSTMDIIKNAAKNSFYNIMMSSKHILKDGNKNIKNMDMCKMNYVFASR